MRNVKPFSLSALNDIFTISSKYPDRINSRESSNLEFKESFNWCTASEYSRITVAFANTKGGYIVFGVANKPHKLIGLGKRSLTSFDEIDHGKVSGFFDEFFAPEIHWDVHIHEVVGKSFGIVYIYESLEKPVVCKKNSGNELKEGDIYYRYRGQTTRIKYPELQAIFDSRRKDEQSFWLKHLAKIARIGVRGAGIFDLQTGEISGTNGSFLIDEALLSQLCFIKEGEFSEVKGKPTLKLIGQVESLGSNIPLIGRKQIIKSKGIRVGDIVLAFLDQQKALAPKEYIKQICFESTAFLPVYYFMHLAELDMENTIKLIEAVVSRSQAKNKLLERIRDRKTQTLSLSSANSSSAILKQQFTKQVGREDIDINLTGKDLNYCLQAFRSIEPNDIKRHIRRIKLYLNSSDM